MPDRFVDSGCWVYSRRVALGGIVSNNLLERITEKSAHIGVIGQGYVGLPLALVFREAGFKVTGFDVDPAKVAAIGRGESFIRHIGAQRVADAVRSGEYTATTDFDRLSRCDAVLICVPTPLGLHREPDNSFIHATALATVAFACAFVTITKCPPAPHF